MRGKTIAGTTVLLLTCLAIAVYVWTVYGGKIAFRPPLFQFEVDAVTALSVRKGQEEIIFSRSEQGWTVSDGQRGGRSLPVTEIHAALRSLLTLFPEGMSATQSEIPLGKGASALVQIRFHDRKDEVFTLFLPDGQQKPASLRFEGQEEVFFVPAPKVAFFFRPFADFNDHLFARPPQPEQVDSLTYSLFRDSLVISFYRDSSKWYFNSLDTLLLDPEAFLHWWAQLDNLSAPLPSLDFDEVQEANSIDRTIVFWSKGRSLLEFEGFTRPWKASPYIVHTSQRPGDYFDGKATGLFRQIFAPLDSLVYPTLKK